MKNRYARVAAEHPEFAGKTATFSQNAFYNGLIYVYPDGLNTEFLTYLGFKMNPKVTALADRVGEQVGISAERLDTLDADVIVFATEEPSDVAKLETPRPSGSWTPSRRTARSTRTGRSPVRSTS